MKKVIIFDVDGTLFDTRDGIIRAFNDVLCAFNKPKIDVCDEYKYIGPSVRNVFKSIVGLDDGDSERATQMYRKIYVEEYIEHSVLYEGARQTIEELQGRDYILCIATMKTKRQIDKLFECFDMNSYFDEIQTAREDGTLSKAEMLNLIREKYGKQVYYMVGDTLGDFAASKQAEMNFIAVKYGYGKFQDNVCGIEYFKQIKEIVC